jgi:hypothetical protein
MDRQTQSVSCPQHDVGRRLFYGARMNWTVHKQTGRTLPVPARPHDRLAPFPDMGKIYISILLTWRDERWNIACEQDR